MKQIIGLRQIYICKIDRLLRDALVTHQSTGFVLGYHFYQSTNKLNSQ